MKKLARRITEMNESQTIKMAQLSRELKAKGIDIIDLSLGEPDFETPNYIRMAAKKAIDENYSKYPPVAGYPDLKQAIADKFKRDNNLDYSPSQIVVSTGAKQSLANALLCLLDPGDEVLVPDPYWVTYSAQIQLAEGIMVTIPTTIDDDFKISADQLQQYITPKTKAFLFSSPCNPTGSVYSQKELEELANVFRQYPDIFIISDEIYEYITFKDKHQSISQFDYLKDRVIIVNGLSKGFAMTGWRIGYMAAPEYIAQACSKMQGQFTSGPNSIAQRAALEAVSGNLGETEKMKEAFRKRKDLFIDLLKDIPGLKLNHPEGAFYLFPNVAAFFGKKYKDPESGKDFTIEDADQLCMYLIKYGRVSVVTGKAFGNDNCIRLSYATSDDNLIEAAKRIKESLAALQD